MGRQVLFPQKLAQVPGQGPVHCGKHRLGVIVCAALRLGDHLVGHPKAQQVGGGELHNSGGLVGPAGVLPQDGGKALGGEDGVHRVLQQEDPVAHRQGQRPAAAPLAGDHRDHRHSEGAHQGQGGGDGLGLALRLRLKAGVGPRRVDEGEDGAAELLRLTHEALGLAVALGAGHPKIALHVLLKGAALPVAQHGDRPAVEAGDGPEDAGILPVEPVPLADKYVGEQGIDKIQRPGTARGAGDLHPLGRGQFAHRCRTPFRWSASSWASVSRSCPRGTI